MRWRIIFFISFGVNLALAAAWIFAVRHPAPAANYMFGKDRTFSTPGKTNVVVRRQFFSWREVESDDYPTYIANLRDIGVPEQTIHDIIMADVNELYAKKRATELLVAQQQWWRSGPDAALTQATTEKIRALEEERHALLARLLGTNGESAEPANLPHASRPDVLLEGPVLGPLSAEVKQSVQQISAHSQDRIQAYLDAQRAAGKNPDPAEVAKLRQQTRTELAGVLSPAPLEEFLLRYSENANNLRNELGQLRYLNATPDEFRAMFRATDSIDQQLASLAGLTDANSINQRNALQQQRENAIKLALGATRYKQYQLLRDPVYQAAFAQAAASDSPGSVQSIYEINLATAKEQARIASNATLTDEQKAIEAKKTELEQLKAIVQAAGRDLPPEQPPVPAPLPTRPHLITSGETVATVSLLYGVPISTIKAANSDLDFTKLRPGDTIRIPQSFLVPKR